jgi:Flp pilus assembly protein TadD
MSASFLSKAHAVVRGFPRVTIKWARSLLACTETDEPELAVRGDDVRLSAMTREASACFERGDLAEAARRYRKLLDVFPDDPVAKSLLTACTQEVQAVDA